MLHTCLYRLNRTSTRHKPSFCLERQVDIADFATVTCIHVTTALYQGRRIMSKAGILVNLYAGFPLYHEVIHRLEYRNTAYMSVLCAPDVHRAFELFMCTQNM